MGIKIDMKGVLINEFTTDRDKENPVVKELILLRTRNLTIWAGLFLILIFLSLLASMVLIKIPFQINMTGSLSMKEQKNKDYAYAYVSLIHSEPFKPVLVKGQRINSRINVIRNKLVTEQEFEIDSLISSDITHSRMIIKFPEESNLSFLAKSVTSDTINIDFPVPIKNTSLFQRICYKLFANKVIPDNGKIKL